MTDSPEVGLEKENKRLKENLDNLKDLCKDLLEGADRCSQKPHFIVQPFLGIVKKHSEIINKYDLFKTGDNYD